jgi:diaminopimelate decarboxylase
VAPLISLAIEKHFPEKNIKFIAEPGRYVSESVVYHASTIIGTKELASGHRHYYLDSGIF